MLERSDQRLGELSFCLPLQFHVTVETKIVQKRPRARCGAPAAGGGLSSHSSNRRGCALPIPRPRGFILRERLAVVSVLLVLLTAAVVLRPASPPTTDPIAAIRAAKAGDTVVVGAGTFTGSVTVPDGVTIVGEGMTSSWIKGAMTFGSNVRVSDLKIGDAGMNAVHNKDGATNTTFERVRFRGGGGRDWTYVVNLGSGSDCDHITFKDCLVERNLGVEVAGSDKGFNNISIWTNVNARVSDITFEGCHIGVSNGQGGHDTGSPRMGLECFVHQETAPPEYGWKNITLRDCVFEAADGHTADFSDIPNARGTGLLIEGCTFKGGGLGGKWGWTVALEMPLNPVIRNNTFLRGSGTWGYVLAVCDRNDTAYKSTGATITGNIFDLDTDNGIAPEMDGWPFVLNGYDNRFTGNTVHCHYGTKTLFALDHAYRNAITGNTFNIGSRRFVTQINGSTDNTVSPNTLM